MFRKIFLTTLTELFLATGGGGGGSSKKILSGKFFLALKCANYLQVLNHLNLATLHIPNLTLNFSAKLRGLCIVG